MEYKGYTGHVAYNGEAQILHGKVIYLKRDAITFQGTSIEEVQQAFKDSVDDYLEWCEERGALPEQPFYPRENLTQLKIFSHT